MAINPYQYGQQDLSQMVSTQPVGPQQPRQQGAATGAFGGTLRGNTGQQMGGFRPQQNSTYGQQPTYNNQAQMGGYRAPQQQQPYGVQMQQNAANGVRGAYGTQSIDPPAQGQLPYNPYQPPQQQQPTRPATFDGNYGPPPMPQYNVQIPQYQTPTYTPLGQGGGAPNGGQFNYYPGLDPTTLENNNEREAKLQAVQASLPIAQFNQNNYQWGAEFDQANQRYWDQTAWQRQGDQFNMGMAQQQQALAQWQAQQAQNQWGQEFGRQTGLDQWNQQFAQQQFGLQEWQTQEQLRQAALGQQQQYQLGQGQLDQLRNYQTGQLQQQANELDQLRNYQTGQLNLGQQTQRDTAAYQMGQLGVAQQQNVIDQMYKSGQLSLGQAQQALAELTQGQNYGLQQQQFGLQQQTQNSLEAYRNAQLQQEAALQREQMAAQQRIATMQAYGRQSAPNTRWIRAS